MVYDGCCSHYNDENLKKSVGIKVILVLLPANATHFIQPLDVAVFKPFKSVFLKCVSDSMLENNITTISKKDAMTIGSKAWRKGILDKTTNISSGFRAAGMWTFIFLPYSYG